MLGGYQPSTLAGPSLVQPRPTAAVGDTVQRLTGFEVETRIPVYNTANEGKEYIAAAEQWSPEIGWFFFSGMEYGYLASDPRGHFALHADHNEIQTMVNRLRAALMAAGMFKEDVPLRNMANLEYVTAARDELGEGSDAILRADLEAMTEHMAATLKLARAGRSQQVPGNVETLLTGVPSQAILEWVEANQGHVGYVRKILEAVEESITDDAYIQQTTGVLPEDIPTLYESSAKAMESSQSAHALAMVDLMIRSTKLAAGVMSKLESDLPESIGRAPQPALGYLTLVATYFLADSLSFTDFSSQAKNLLPHLPKVMLHHAFDALPEAIRGEPDFWKLAFGLVGKESEKVLPAYWTRYGFTVNQQQEEGVIFEDPPGESQKGVAEVLHVLETEDEDRVVMLGSMKPNLSLDQPPAPIAEATGQKAIPLEDRFFGSKFPDKLGIGDVAKVLTLGFNESRKLQAGHLESSELLDKTGDKPSKSALAWMQFADQRGRLLGFSDTFESNIERFEFDLENALESEQQEQQSLDETREQLQEKRTELELRDQELQRAKSRLEKIDQDLEDLYSRELSINQMSNVIELEDEMREIRNSEILDLVWRVNELEEDEEEFAGEVLKQQTAAKAAKQGIVDYRELKEITDLSLGKTEHLEPTSEVGELSSAGEFLAQQLAKVGNGYGLLRNQLTDKDKRLTRAKAQQTLVKTHAGSVRQKHLRLAKSKPVGEQAQLLEKANEVWQQMKDLAQPSQGPERDAQRIETFLEQLKVYIGLFETLDI